MKLKLEKARLSFVELAEPKSKFNGDPKYSLCILVDKETEHGKKNMEQFKAICEQLEREKFDGKKLPISKLCVSDGNEKDIDGWQNMIVFTAANKSRPITIGKKKQAVVAGDEQFPYSGCFANVMLDVWPLTGQYGPRIVASVEGVQFYSEGESFSSSSINIDNDFDVVEEETTTNTLEL